jgi:hypothetical protein
MDVVIEITLAYFCVEAPDSLGKLIAGNDLAGAADQRFKQHEFSPCKFDWLA